MHYEALKFIFRFLVRNIFHRRIPNGQHPQINNGSLHEGWAKAEPEIETQFDGLDWMAIYSYILSKGCGGWLF